MNRLFSLLFLCTVLATFIFGFTTGKTLTYYKNQTSIMVERTHKTDKL